MIPSGDKGQSQSTNLVRHSPLVLSLFGFEPFPLEHHVAFAFEKALDHQTKSTRADRKSVV